MSNALYQRVQTRLVVRDIVPGGRLIDLNKVSIASGVPLNLLRHARVDVVGTAQDVHYACSDSATLASVHMPSGTRVVTHGGEVGGQFVPGNDVVGLTSGTRGKVLERIDATNILVYLDVSSATFTPTETLQERTPEEAKLPIVPDDPTGVTAVHASDVQAQDTNESEAFTRGSLVDYALDGRWLAVNIEAGTVTIKLVFTRASVMGQKKV